MKIFISIIALACISIGLFISVQNDKKEICIEDWYAQTSQLFQSASSFFSNMGNDPSENDKADEIDAKLQALLPAENIDLSYHSEVMVTASNSTLVKPEQGLLPDLFHQPDDPTTKVKGQVFTDEEDNIVGAELNLSIPTDMR